MTKDDSKQKFFVVGIDRSSGEIVSHVEIPIAEMKMSRYSIKIEEVKKKLIEEHWWLPSKPKFFTGLATSFDALLYGYPEMTSVGKPKLISITRSSGARSYSMAVSVVGKVEVILFTGNPQSSGSEQSTVQPSETSFIEPLPKQSIDVSTVGPRENVMKISPDSSHAIAI